MHHLGPLAFTAYDLMRGAAVAGSILLCLFLNHRQNISVQKTLLIAAICVPVAIAAARLLNALESSSFSLAWGAEFMRNSGSSIYGALIACIFSVLALTRAMHLSALAFLDAG